MDYIALSRAAVARTGLNGHPEGTLCAPDVSLIWRSLHLGTPKQNPTLTRAMAAAATTTHDRIDITDGCRSISLAMPMS